MNLAATMSLNGAGFAGPLGAIRGQMSGFVGQLKGLFPLITGLGGAFAAFKSAEAIVENLFKQFEKGHQLERMSRITGESVRDLVVLQKAMTMTGGDAAGLPRLLAMLQKSLGGVNEEGQPTKAIFDQLHLRIEALKKLRAPEQIDAIGTKIRALATPAERTAAAFAIFGRSGQEMLAVLNDPTALKDAISSTREIGSLFERNAKVFSEIIRNMNAIKAKIGTLFAGIAEGAAPAFQAILGWLKKLDLARIGREIGQMFRAIPAAIQSGQIGELLNLTLQTGMAKAINFFAAYFRASIAGMGEVLSTVFGNLGSITDVLVGAAAQFGAAMLKAVEGPLSYVQAAFQQIFDTRNSAKSTEAEERARKELFDKGQFAGLSRQQLNGRFGALTRTPEEDARLKAYQAALAKRTAELEKEAGYITFAERQQGVAKEGVKFGFGGQSYSIGELEKMGRDTTNQGLAALRAPMSHMLGNIAGMVRDFHVDDIAGAGPLGAQLKALINKLAPPPKTEKDGEASAGAGVSLGGMRAPKVESDRLARIGGFIGGAGGPALDYARRTANGIERLVGLVKDAGRIGPAGHLGRAGIVGAWG